MTRQNILILAATRVRIGQGLGREVNPIESETDPDPCQIHHREMIVAASNAGYQPKAL